MQQTLAHKHFGTTGKPPLVILHGLLGSSRNWSGVGKALSRDWDVYALDLRNHGDSPWADDMSYTAMAEDMRQWIDAEGLVDVCLLGHSLGGKVALRLAADTPEYLRSLVVVDISLRPAKPRWDRELRVLREMLVATMQSRKEAEDILEEKHIGDWAFRKFLLTNLVRAEEGGFRWKCNLESLHRNLEQVFQPPLEPNDVYNGSTLVIRGEKSQFLSEEDQRLYAQHCPNMRWATVPEAGHNVHAEQPDRFVELFSFYGEYLG